MSNAKRTDYLKTCFSSVNSFSLISRSSSNLSMIIEYDSLTFFFHSSKKKLKSTLWYKYPQYIYKTLSIYKMLKPFPCVVEDYIISPVSLIHFFRSFLWKKYFYWKAQFMNAQCTSTTISCQYFVDSLFDFQSGNRKTYTYAILIKPT